MHRAAKGVARMAAAADVREKFLQGEAAGRNMAVPVNWRVLDVQDVLKKLGAAMMQDRLASARLGGNALDNVGCVAAAVIRYSRADIPSLSSSPLPTVEALQSSRMLHDSGWSN
jgi:hypothetical protein